MSKNTSTVDSKETCEFLGVVKTDCKSDFLVAVQTDKGEHIIKCRPKGVLRTNNIQILVDDKVRVVCSPTDLNRGLIVERITARRR